MDLFYRVRGRMSGMVQLFGTDGVRGVANRALTPDLALALGRAAGIVMATAGGQVVVGRDTRLSGPMLEDALVAGLCSSGTDVLRLGVVPTPAVAYLTTELGARAGSMVSASHNPVPDNGIKFFSDEGTKIPSEVEAQIEVMLETEPEDLPIGTDIGGSADHAQGVHRYQEHLIAAAAAHLDGMKVVLDLAHGSAYEVAPAAFRTLGADVITINDEPDGARINVQCGSTDLSHVARRVVEEGAALGLAFDGDADRVLACDEHGETIDGDQIIALFALDLQDQGLLKNDTVVATVMTNLGFMRALKARGIEVVQAPVGDRFVMEAMIESGAVLGGEQSGHVIFANHATTGDGILSALLLADAVARSGEPLSSMARVFERVPQVLLNVNVRDRSGLESAGAVWEEVQRAEAALGEEGRVLLRGSGTEPVVRVMVEALDRAAAEEWAERLAQAVAKNLS